RLSSTYPCRENCTDPNLGVIALSAQYRGRESVDLANTGGLPVDLEQYRLTSAPWGYSFSPNSVLQPGETMRIRLWESVEEDEEHLIRHWPVGPILNNAGDSLQLRRYDDVVIACTAWGTRSC
ncbi:MAG TPA: lamin tail domain-containing protein, partial [Pyrinomonadaceae bacterium]|nr:lamin tail domain-containing protein [Pyrinomonadaceae bacterium]